MIINHQKNIGLVLGMFLKLRLLICLARVGNCGTYSFALLCIYDLMCCCNCIWIGVSLHVCERGRDSGCSVEQ